MYEDLVWWVMDLIKHGLVPQVANFMPEVMMQFAQEEIFRKDLAETEPTITNLGKFD